MRAGAIGARVPRSHALLDNALPYRMYIDVATIVRTVSIYVIMSPTGVSERPPKRNSQISGPKDRPNSRFSHALA